MKKTNISTLVLVVILLVAGCTKKNTTPDTNVKPLNENVRANAMLTSDSPFIRVDSANKMLTSYLASVNTTSHADDLHSLIIDAEALRTYLADADIKHVKIMFAHRLDYINSGNAGVYAGNKINALTVVIAGYDEDNNYVCTPTGTYLDNAAPCPYSCPQNGTASSDLLPQ